jgi:NAD(P)H-flavin reductase
MCKENNSKSLLCELTDNIKINNEMFILQFFWSGPAPKAGQFFMIKPERTSVFLCRPFAIFEYDQNKKLINFLIEKNGRGTEELSQLLSGERARLTGPNGNTFAEFLGENKKIALVGGNSGIAPLAALVCEKPEYQFHFYAGLKNGFEKNEEEKMFLGSAKNAQKLVVTAEDGKNAIKGLIVDFLEPENYDAIFVCGSNPMIKAVKEKIVTKGNTSLFVSGESRMACGTGACLGCTVRTKNGNKRSCTDGPIFPAGDLLDE